jgi:Beta-galactosidase
MHKIRSAADIQEAHSLGWLALAALIALLLPSPLFAKTVVFWQPGFPFVASQPVERGTLAQALDGFDAQFLDLKSMADPAALKDTDLLVLPYGSAVPTDAWKAIEEYLHAGGNLLVVGGQPLHVPVSEDGGNFLPLSPQDSYARVLDFLHTYEVPVPADARFAWKSGYDFPQTPQVHAQRFFAVEGRLDGLGYMVEAGDRLTAAPVIVADHAFGPMQGSRVVALDFDPEPGYWKSGDGIALIRQSAIYASHGATQFSVELQFSTLRPGEPPLITVHLRSLRRERLGTSENGEVKLTLSSGNEIVDSATLPIADTRIADVAAPFHKALAPGFYKLTATFTEGGQLREFYQNGFWVAETSDLNSGPALGVRGDFLTRDGVPFFPVGTNYFTTEGYGFDFSSARNAGVWEKDFSDMERHGVTFVRTGVWMPNLRFVEMSTGGANERFLRNLEAFLHCAQQHKIAVNFTFFAFTPRAGTQGRDDPDATLPNPYTDPGQVQLQQAYIRSVIERFKAVPWLSWDLINEPSFSNPRHIFKGNYPNGDPTETAAWHKWLRQKYDGNLAALADAWRVPAEQLGAVDAIPLPSPSDLTASRSGDPNEVRALDYSLFAQDGFIDWLRSMIGLIRGLGSKQLIDIGQDEGGVMDRVLNQFYGGAGVSFTTNHTYWQDDGLLWDSVAAKRVGVPNITGETGYQPVWAPDGAWRYDELTGVDLIERKWALGFAAGSTGAMQWDWGRGIDFGMLRSDGSAKVWEDRMKDLGAFAAKAAPLGTGILLPDVAIVLPQSFQLSVGNQFAIEAQKNAIRALYSYARSQAYAVGEYQTDLLGSPKLILLPSPMGLTEAAWQAIEDRVKSGAVLLITGPFAADAHLHDTGRQDAIGLPYGTEALNIRDHLMHFPGGDEQLSFPGDKTTYLSRAALPGGEDWSEAPLGKGKILFAALPLELNDNLQAIGDVYSYALKVAGVAPAYSTALKDPGILICPTRFPEATLYVITSESNETQVNFEDVRSGKQFAGTLASGRAAILLVGADGTLIAAYNWSGS